MDSPIARKFDQTPRTPYRLEARFVVNIDLGDEVGMVRTLGYIDRLDRQGDAVIVIDYKSGSTTIPTSEMEAGRNFQMMVYLLGAEDWLRQEGEQDTPTMVKGGIFWHIQNRKTSGAIRTDEEGKAILEKARHHLARAIVRARQGDFAVYPTKPDFNRCVRYCDFHQFCRVSVTQRHKA